MAGSTTLELGAAVRARRRERALTQGALADAAGVSRAFVSELERGERAGAELSRVLAVLRALDLSITLTPSELPPFESMLADLVRGQG